MRTKRDKAHQIYQKLKGARGVDEHELWQHALFLCQNSGGTMSNQSSKRPLGTFLKMLHQEKIPQEE